MEDLVTNLQSSKMTLEDQLSREVGGIYLLPCQENLQDRFPFLTLTLFSSLCLCNTSKTSLRRKFLNVLSSEPNENQTFYLFVKLV